jgi:hypothetical protein
MEQDNRLQQVESHEQGSLITCTILTEVIILGAEFLRFLRVTTSDAKIIMMCKPTGKRNKLELTLMFLIVFYCSTNTTANVQKLYIIPMGCILLHDIYVRNSSTDSCELLRMWFPTPLSQLSVFIGVAIVTASQHVSTTLQQKKEKCATFTYIGKETRTIAKLFRNTHTKIAYRTTNTIQNHLRKKTHDNIYNKSEVYQLKCGGCQKKYVGQTGRNFQTRYKEHIHAIRSNNSNSKYAQHILETQHPYGPMTNIMEVLHLNKKGQGMNTWEYYIYTLSKDRLQLNDTYTDTHNPIFKLINNYSKRIDTYFIHHMPLLPS